MSDSVWPHRHQPTRLPRPWDSPGKNTGVGCCFFLQCMKVKHESEVAQSCPTLRDPMDCSLPGCSIHGIFQARVLEWGATAFSESVTLVVSILGASQVVLVVKNSPANAGDAWDAGFIPSLGRSPGVVNGKPLQHSFLENSMGRRACWATVHRATKSQTTLSNGAAAAAVGVF